MRTAVTQCIACFAAALPLLALAAPAESWTALLKKIPEMPTSVAQAAAKYAAATYDAGGSSSADAHWRDVQAAAVAPELQRRIAALSAAPPVGMTGSEDPEAMAARMENMSQEQQMAMAMQMMQQMNAGSQAPATEFSPADQKLIDRYSARSESHTAQYQHGIALGEKIRQTVTQWEQEHVATEEQYQKQMDAVTGCNADAAELKVQQAYRTAQAALGARHFAAGAPLAGEQRKPVAEDAAFMDANAPSTAQMQDPRIRPPVTAQVQHTIQLANLYLGSMTLIYDSGSRWSNPRPLGTYVGGC
jgi:hypothetical protein